MFKTIKNLGKDLMSSGSLFRSSTREVGGFWNFQATSLEGDKVDFSRYQGCVDLIINVASKWGKASSSYKALNELYSKHKDEGLRILAFPSLDFGGQEYKDPKQIRRFVDGKGVRFDVFRLTKVSGPDMSSIYNYLFKCTASHAITWNFSTVFIVGRDGSVRARIDKPQTDNWALVKRELESCLKEDFKGHEQDEKKGDSDVKIPECDTTHIVHVD